jgi:drug/metabolite transporter (DMT)-like permease
MVIPRVNPRIFAAFTAIYVLWGSTYLAVALALPSFPPFLLMGSRPLFGGAMLLLAARPNLAAWSLWQWLLTLACGMLFFVGCHGVLAYAQQRVPSGVASIILASIPFWIALAEFTWPPRQSADPLTIATLAPGFAGVALIAWREVTAGRSGPSLVDIGLLLASSMSWALGSVLSKRYTSPDVSAFAFSGLALLIGGGMLVGIAVGSGEFAHFDPGHVSLAAGLSWLYLAVAGTVVAFGAYVWLLGRVSPALVGTYTFVNPVIAVLLGRVILDEPLSPTMLLGALLVVGSIIALLRRQAAETIPHPKELRRDLKLTGRSVSNGYAPRPPQRCTPCGDHCRGARLLR